MTEATKRELLTRFSDELLRLEIFEAKSITPDILPRVALEMMRERTYAKYPQADTKAVETVLQLVATYINNLTAEEVTEDFLLTSVARIAIAFDQTLAKMLKT